ncbi:DUF3558 domain-containing protein [Rhodococcoides fascians A25f]|uniref:DUF3558 domain-containing protein n=1 Tax=Rhodococcoides fascians TaxID=1828 RepID=UPI0012D34F83|nr:DUF3558 domain-containing protein [Rhodococcus fascians]QII05093.1 DUF3558 domain-containing protein [Rhodococcus fascians A25f]
MTRWWVTGVVGVMVLVAGCGNSTSGAPVADSPTTTSEAPSAAEPWDPCSIPNNAIEAAGLDVGSKTSTLVGDRPISTDWMICSWRNPDPGSWYFLGVFSSDHDLAYLKGNDQFGEFVEVDNAGAVQFRRTANYDEVSCGVAYEVVGGIVYFILDGRASREPQGDPCVEVERVGSALRSSLPPSSR